MIFGMGPLELIIILAVVLIIFGPKNLPKLGKSLGQTVKSVREGMEEDDDDSKKKVEESQATSTEVEAEVHDVAEPAEDAAPAEADAAADAAAAEGDKFCPSCGAKNPASNKFCAKCGTKLQ